MIGRELLSCRRTAASDVEEWNVILCNDVLLMTQAAAPHALLVHLLENCTAMEAHDRAIEIADSSSNHRWVLIWRVFRPVLRVRGRLTIGIGAPAETRQQWMRWLQFAITVTKAKRSGGLAASPARGASADNDK